MSLVGTRPPTVDEWDKYELHHRARLATKPGLTGMWQVSGRSNITDFEEVVKLDKQYISEWTLKISYYRKNKRNTLLQTAKGCENTCIFCQRKGWQSCYVTHSDDYVLNEIKDIKSKGYILFLACYLHDISMVKIPACDSFLLDTDKADELAKTLLDSYNEEFNKANLTKNVQGNDIDILSVKKYMLDSYRKIDNYFEEAVRSKHANDSAAEIRKRSELNYLDTSMRELVAEVSEAHGADERDIYGIKSVASKQLISIKFDKILLRLADLLDMSSYRVSKPILYHNVEQMSEESAFHWISHLLTKGYSLRTEYEITDNAHVLAPKNIIEKLVLEIPVNISQMSALTCGRTCKKVGIDRNRLSQQGIVLVCGQECKDNGNQERNCNFLCKWFCVKNENLIKELAALKEYLNRNKNNYFKSAIEIRIKCNDRTSLDARQFEILNEYIGKM